MQRIMFWIRVAAIIVTALLLLARFAVAGPITSNTQSGSCVRALPSAGAWWEGDAVGFVFFAAHDAKAGCDPTVTVPTNGTYRRIEGGPGYRIEVLPEWLPKCGRVQFDAQAYTPTGLDPAMLRTLVYDAGVDCTLASEQPLPPVLIVRDMTLHDEHQPTPTPAPVPVPEPSAGVLLVLGLTFWPLLHRFAEWTTRRDIR